MSKLSPTRLAVNHLKAKGIISKDNELQEILGIDQKTTLSNYIKAGFPPLVMEKFMNKFGDEVSVFFKDGEDNGNSVTKYTNALERIVELQDEIILLKDDLRELDKLRAFVRQYQEDHPEVNSDNHQAPDQNSRKNKRQRIFGKREYPRKPMGSDSAGQQDKRNVKGKKDKE